MSSNYGSTLEVFAELLATSYDLVSPPTPAFLRLANGFASLRLEASADPKRQTSSTALLIQSLGRPRGLCRARSIALGPPDRCDK